jgi:hypothetical protein
VTLTISNKEIEMILENRAYVASELEVGMDVDLGCDHCAVWGEIKKIEINPRNGDVSADVMVKTGWMGYLPVKVGLYKK